MLLRVNNPVVVGPRNDFGEVWALADDGAGAGLRTTAAGSSSGSSGSAAYPHDYEQGDFNPERIQLEDDIVPGATPAVNVGDHVHVLRGRSARVQLRQLRAAADLGAHARRRRARCARSQPRRRRTS